MNEYNNDITMWLSEKEQKEYQIYLKNRKEKSQELIDKLNKHCFGKRHQENPGSAFKNAKPEEMLASFQWYRQNNLPAEINLQIEKFALEETDNNKTFPAF